MALATGVGDRDDRQVGGNEKYTRKGNPALGRLTGREKEFEELGDLTALYEGLSAKTRQHVNPLADHFQVPTLAPNWAEIYADPSLPLQVDVGCGSGRFVLMRAQRLAGCTSNELSMMDDAGEHDDVGEDDDIGVPLNVGRNGKPSANVLGMEIRQKLVDRAQAWTQRLDLSNCHFVFTNATVSWKSLLGNYPGPIDLVSMQFPDPHFKARHHKRRHVQPQLVCEIAETLAPGARIFLQGDVPEAVRWMRDMFEEHGNGCFALAPECRDQNSLMREEWETCSSNGNELGGACQQDECQLPLRWSADRSAGWLPENPLGVPTEREVYVSQINAPVYRVMLVRT